MADPKDKQPAEGSREVLDRELRRQGETSEPQDEKGAGDKGPAKPVLNIEQKEKR